MTQVPNAQSVSEDAPKPQPSQEQEKAGEQAQKEAAEQREEEGGYQ